MSEEKNYEEKDEKEMMKHDEKVEQNDKLSSIVWAFILMWAGFVFLAANMGWFAMCGFNVDTTWIFSSFSNWQSFGVWNLVALGAGGIILIESIVRLLVPKYRRHVASSLIGAAIFIGIGLGGWYNWNYIWPLILIAVGVNVLITGFKRR